MKVHQVSYYNDESFGAQNNGLWQISEIASIPDTTIPTIRILLTTGPKYADHPSYQAPLDEAPEIPTDKAEKSSKPVIQPQELKKGRRGSQFVDKTSA